MATDTKPVAWMFSHKTDNEVFVALNKARMDPRYWTETPLYAAPQPCTDCDKLRDEVERLREELAEAYIKLSGKNIHTSDCATSNAPAMEPGPCNCDAPGDADLVAKLRDTDSYYRLQEKHWCIDHEELERQRLAAADALERLKGYAEHLFICDHHEWEGGAECSCGLTALLKEIEGHD